MDQRMAGESKRSSFRCEVCGVCVGGVCVCGVCVGAYVCCVCVRVGGVCVRVWVECVCVSDIPGELR